MKNYFEDTVNCTDLEEYKKLPLEARTTKKWFWPFDVWYLPPMGLPINIDDFEENGKFNGEWEKCYDFLREQFRFQVFIRHDWRNLKSIEWIRFKWRDFDDKVIYKAKCLFSPRNKVIAAQIPREYKAASDIINDVLTTIFFEKYKEINHWLNFDEWTPEEAKEYWRKEHAKYQKIANWIKVEKPALEKELEKAWGNVSREKGLTYEQRYGGINRLEEKIRNGDTEVLKFVIDNRESFD